MRKTIQSILAGIVIGSIPATIAHSTIVSSGLSAYNEYCQGINCDRERGEYENRLKKQADGPMLTVWLLSGGLWVILALSRKQDDSQWLSILTSRQYLYFARNSGHDIAPS